MLWKTPHSARSAVPYCSLSLPKPAPANRRPRHKCRLRPSRGLPPDKELVLLPLVERWGSLLQKTLQDIEGFSDAHNAALEDHLQSAQWLFGEQRDNRHPLSVLQRRQRKVVPRQGPSRRKGSKGSADSTLSSSSSSSSINCSSTLEAFSLSDRKEDSLERSTLEQSSVERSSLEESSAGEPKGSPAKDGTWVLSGALLVVGALLPAIVECALYENVLQLEHEWKLTLILLTDTTFVATTFAFLLSGENFGRQRCQAPQSYPGPWVEPGGAVVHPSHFFFYLVGFPALIGLAMPVAAIAYAHAGTEHGQLTTLALAPYLATLLVQIYTEKLWVSRGSFMWPMVPIVHMLYRFWQLGRGCVLVSLLHGPQWLIFLQAVLAVLWTFNFGAVMAWMPWLYRWHCQPQLADMRVEADQQQQ